MKLVRLSVVALLSATIFSACVKQKYDYPPDTSTLEPNLTVTSSMKALTNSALMMQSGQNRVLGDTIISGIVVADDRSGNFYKKVIFQDSSYGGLVLLLDKTYLYADYPIGRRIYVNTKGLLLVNDKGLPTLAYSVDAVGNVAIPSALIKSYVTKGSYPNKPYSRRVTLEDVFSNSAKYLNTLVEIYDVQFANGSNNMDYAAPSAQSSGTNRTVQDCVRSVTITMYNSGYATFQPAKTPNGNGTIWAIYSTYGSTPQLLIRDTSDVRLTNARNCP